MNSMGDTFIGDWKREKVLGTGGFGTVVLWINTKTNEELALKECRWGHDAGMTPKHKQRWKLEVDIMRRLEHPNVVKAFEVPPELDVPGSSLPIMAMEYCEGGDLRKMLNKPEYSCGFPEKQTRILLRHVVSAVEYLHCMRIIHRDLKPENIVVQEKNGKTLYKLIDLGYAKELDQGSLCTSFVGTLQYLAPELFLSQTYTSVVDFWSLGLVAHEVITGQRPFLPNMSPAQWIPVVRHKTSEDIRAYLNNEGKVVFSKEISPYNQISGSLKVDIEKWLRLLLEFDPQVRGSQKANIFQFFNELINKTVVEVLSLDSCQIYSYSVNQSTNLQMISENLEKDTGIPVKSQLILLPKGVPPDPAKNALQCWTNPEEEDNIIFLFNASALSLAPPFRISIPPLVESIMRYPNEEIPYDAQKNAWQEAIFLCQKQQALHKRLTSAFRASLLHLLRKNTSLIKLCNKMKRDRDGLAFKYDFFKASLHQDLVKLDSLVKENKTGLEIKWNNYSDKFERFNKMCDDIDNIEKQCLQLSSKTVDPQKCPYARSKSAEFLDETYRNVVNMYGQLRRRSREERKLRNDNTEIVRLLCDSLQTQDKVFQEIYQNMKLIDEVKIEIDKISPVLENIVAELNRLEQILVQSQMERQDDIWNLYKQTNESLKKNPALSDPMSKSFDAVFLNGQNTLRQNLNEATNPLITSMTSSTASADELNNSLMYTNPEYLQSLGSLLQQHTFDSRKVRMDNEVLRKELDSMLNVLNETAQLFDE